MSSVDIVSELNLTEKISARTVRHHLQIKLNPKAFKPAKKPLLSAKNLRDRLNFCKKYKTWTAEQWMKVLFSDEVKNVQFSGTKQFVRRPPNKRYNPKYTIQTVKFHHLL